MKKTLIAACAATALALPAIAADDPVAVRKALMQGVGGAAGAAGGMLKGEIDYNPAVGKAAIAAIAASAQAYGDYFPDGSDADERTTASPKIWEDAAGFQAELDKLKTTSMAAFEASGKDGPADIEAFKTAVGPVLGTCKGCHEGYRIKK